MNLDSRPLLASLADPIALFEYGIADGSPTTRVLNMDPALPIWVRGATLELGVELTHARLRAEHAGLACEVARRTPERRSAPSAHAFCGSAAGGKRLAGSPHVGASLAAKLLPLRNDDRALSAAPSSALSPSVDEVAFTGAEFLCISARCHVPGTALLASGHEAIIAYGFEISHDYCEIARRRLAEIDAQPNLFEPKPEQLTL